MPGAFIDGQQQVSGIWLFEGVSNALCSSVIHGFCLSSSRLNSIKAVFFPLSRCHPSRADCIGQRHGMNFAYLVPTVFFMLWRPARQEGIDAVRYPLVSNYLAEKNASLVCTAYMLIKICPIKYLYHTREQLEKKNIMPECIAAPAAFLQQIFMVAPDQNLAW